MHWHVGTEYWFIIVFKTRVDIKSACFLGYLLRTIVFVFLLMLCLAKNTLKTLEKLENNFSEISFIISFIIHYFTSNLYQFKLMKGTSFEINFNVFSINQNLESTFMTISTFLFEYDWTIVMFLLAAFFGKSIHIGLLPTHPQISYFANEDLCNR